MKVLHIAEAYGGGVESAISAFVRNTPTVEHRILAFRRPGHSTADPLANVQIIEMPRGRWAQLRAVRAVVKAVQPDVVHAHSSLGGLYVRALPSIARSKIVYTPHCFAFERRDVPRAVRAAFWLVEAALGVRTAAYAAVSPREAELARRLPGRAHVTYVPNTAGIALVAARRAPRSSPARVAGVGRICPQKGFEFFATAAVRYRLLDAPPADWTWIGGGETLEEEMLRFNGVAVTGWINRHMVQASLRNSDVYVHTAAWEGAPVSLQEAAALALPMAYRNIPALKSLGLMAGVSTPNELAWQVARLLESETRYAEASRASTWLAQRHSPAAQNASLLDLYGKVASQRSVLLPTDAAP